VTLIVSRARTNMPQALTGVPPFPAVAIRALKFISNESGQLRALSELIATDSALSGEILRVVNSPLVGLRNEISSILQAIVLLGLEHVKGVVLTIATKSYLGDSLEIPALRACWRHSLACAVIAKDLAPLSLVEPDVAVTSRHHEPAVDGEPTLLTIVRNSCRMADALGFSVSRPLQLLNYEEVLSKLPPRERSQLPSEPTKLARTIAIQVNSIEGD
jgi:hypothetical protein